jgi:hypothetical protein
LSPKEAKQIKTSVERGRQLGDDNWVQQTARQPSLESTLRHRGGQPKHGNGNEE